MPALNLIGRANAHARHHRGSRNAALTRLSVGLVTVGLVQLINLLQYVDPGGRFRFAYPASFGAPSAGTNDGFGYRAAAVRFAAFSSPLGGEAVLMRDLPLADLQAVGGLYDPITLEAFPEPLRRTILRALTPLSPTTFCREIAREQHLSLDMAVLASLTPQQKLSVAATDRLRNVEPRVLRCQVDGDTVTFDKEVTFQVGGPRQRLYGAIRFLDGRYSTFQIVRAGAAPDSQTLDAMTAVVKSWTGG